MVAMESSVEPVAAVSAHEGFDDFFAAHYPKVVRSLTLATGDQAKAEELAQDAFAKACVRWQRVSAMDRPATWAYVAAVNADRRRYRRDAKALDVTPIVEDVSDGTASVLERLTVSAALGQLAPRQRLAVVLRYFAGLQISEIAAAMKCAEGTVKSTIHAALERLRIDLEDTP